MISLGKSTFINGEQHHLYEIEDDEDWSRYPWRIHHFGKMYWLPVK